MKRTIDITLRTAAAILAMILAAGCVFEKDNPVKDGELRSMMVQLGVTTDGGMTATKADAQAEGTSVENTINTLRVYAYTGEQGSERLCGYLYAEDVLGVNSTTSKAYMMDIRLPYSQMNKTHNITFKAVANAEAMRNAADLDITELGRDGVGAFVFTGNLAYGTFDSIKYYIPNQDFVSEPEEGTDPVFLGMPMYCVTKPISINLANTVTATQQAVNAADHAGHTLVANVPITLTRSLAKIEVYAAEDAGAGTSSEKETDITITGVTIYNAVKDGLLFGGTLENPDTEESVSLFETGQTVDVAHAVAEADATTGTYTPVAGPYYLAENKVQSTYGFGMIGDGETLDTDGGETFLQIDYEVGDTPYSGYVQMPPIERNTWYKVLARITAGGQMTLTFVAQPWNLVTEELTYDDNVSVTEGKIKWSVEPNSNAEVVTTGNDLSCEFTIATPSYATWHASFIPLEGDQNAFGFVTTDENLNVVTVPTFSGPVGSPAKLTIRPLVQNPTQTNKARLRIIVRTDEGRTIVVKNSILSGNNDYSNDEYILIHSM